MSSPIAQSFFVNPFATARIYTSGVYITKVDLFFATKDSSLPVIVEIREMDPASGLFTDMVIPFSRVVVASSSINTSSDGSAPTPIYFPAPVHLLVGRNYAVVVVAAGGSPNYSVWVARLGDNDTITGNRITSQPDAGILFASSNDRSFSAVQEEDMKIRIYSAKFDKTVLGTMIIKNEPRDYMVITDQSGGVLRTMGETVHGETLLVGTFANTKTLSVANSTTFAQGMTSGATGIITSFAAAAVRIRNVTTAAKFAGGERIRVRTNNATTGGIVGNSTGGITSATTPTARVTYLDSVNYSNTHLHVANVSYSNSGAAGNLNRMFFANTWIRGQTNGYIAKCASFGSIKADLINFSAGVITPSNTSVASYVKMATSATGRDTSYIKINLNDDTEFTAPRYVYSRSQESNTTSTTSTLASNRSAEIKINLTSNNNLGSPAIDLRRISLITVENLINSNSTIGTSEDGVKTGGLAKARYITRRVTLADGQDAEDLRVYITAYKPSTASIYAYYKILHREDSDIFDNSVWVPMTRVTDQGSVSTSAYSSSEDPEDFIELAYEIPDYSNTYRSGANTTNSDIVEYRNTYSARFVGFKYFAIKIVLMNDASSRPPRIRDLRAIALQR